MKEIKRLNPGMIVKVEGINDTKVPSVFYAVVVSVEPSRVLIAKGLPKTDWSLALDYPDCIQGKSQERITEVAKGRYACRKLQ